MTSTATVTGHTQGLGESPRDTVPLVVAIVACATTLILGLIWDISWHQSVGRDTLFSPPHVVEYVSAALAGAICAVAIIRMTVSSTAADRAWSVRVWGFRGPLGVWITLWGVLTLLCAIPLDDWWHAAYGLDVKVFAPAHVMLNTGITAILIGAVVLTAAIQNRAAEGHGRVREAWLYAIAGGALCNSSAVLSLNVSLPMYQHSAIFYIIWALLFPPLLVCYARVGRQKYPATAAAGVFMLIWFLMGQVLRQVPATPHLGPIYNHRTYMWPPFFPNLLIVPALGIDLIRPRLKDLDSWWAAAVMGVCFLVMLLVVQWPFSRFMIGAGAENWFFNGNEHSYLYIGTDVHRFRPVGSTPLIPGLLLATFVSIVTSRVGLAWGAWMGRIRR
ncbi:MAG: hypothetical protein U0132_23060 [Gemmatimonadaceae bacterium]